MWKILHSFDKWPVFSGFMRVKVEQEKGVVLIQKAKVLLVSSSAKRGSLGV